MNMEMTILATSNLQKLRIRKSKFPFTEPEGGFDSRIVRYEHVHSIKETDFDELVRIIEPRDKETILDAGSGYGSVSREILKRFSSLNLEVILYDLHEVQLNRGIHELAGFFNEEYLCNQINFVHGDLRNIDLPNNSIDKIIAKMVIHEIPQHDQKRVFSEFYRVLKPGGKLIIWDTNLNKKNQNFFQTVIRKKDELATFNHLEGTRYFLKEEEIHTLANSANFNHFKKEYTINYRVDTGKRLTAEFKDDLNKLINWNNFIREQANNLSIEILKEIDYCDKQKTIEFNVEKAIFTCSK